MDRNDENLLPDLIAQIQKTIMKGIDKSLPCVVTEVISRTKVNVRPLINMVDEQGNSYERDVIEGVPVETWGAGDTFISFPLSSGSLGWIDAADRDLGLFLQTYESEKPSTARMHSFSDARFIPDIMTNFTVSAEDEAALVISNRSGSVKIALDQDEIRMNVTGGDIVMNGARITPDGDVVTASGVSLDNHLTNVPGVQTGPSTVVSEKPTPE